MGVQTPVKHADLTDEQITVVQKAIVETAKKNEFFNQFVNKKQWQKGSKTMSYRKLIKPKVKPEDVQPLQEGVAPRPTKMAYATFQIGVQNYGDKVPYTDEAVYYNIDDVVRDAGATLGYLFTQKLDYIKGKPFINSRATITYDTSILKTMAKAKIVLKKNEAKYWDAGHYLMLGTPEVIEKLKDELQAIGAGLDEATKTELARGIVGRKRGFVIAEVPSDLFQDGENHYVVFMGRQFDGTSPIDAYQIGEVEVINNPLGSGVLQDEDGNITADDNKQIGSVAMNARGLCAVLADDLAVLNCKVAVDTINGSELGYNELSHFVSSSPNFKLTVSPVDSDGDAITGTTIVVKDAKTETTITASNGVYPVVAGQAYTYTVSKSGLKTVNGRVVIAQADLALVVPMVASA